MATTLWHRKSPRRHDFSSNTSGAAARRGAAGSFASRRLPRPRRSLCKIVLRLVPLTAVMLLCGYAVWVIRCFQNPQSRQLGFGSSNSYYSLFPGGKCRTQIRLCMDGRPCTTEEQFPLPWASGHDQGGLMLRNINNNSYSSTAGAVRDGPNKKPLVCVVVTTYNVESYVSQAMDSILKQTHQNVEIVAVDDASSDKTPAVLSRYVALDSRVRLVQLLHNTNGGTGQPSNIGMDSCSQDSEYIMFMDGDDYMEKDAIASVLHHAQRFDSDVVMADFDLFSVNETTQELSFDPAYDHQHWDNVPTDYPFNILTHPRALRISPVPWRKLYKRSLLVENNLQFLEGDYFYEDNAFHWMALGHATRVSKLNRTLFHHRTNRQGQTSSGFFMGNETTSEEEYWKNYNAAARIAGYFPNLHQIGKLLFSGSWQSVLKPCTGVAVKDVAEVYFQFIKASGWISKKQTTKQMEDKFLRLLDQTKDHWFQHNIPAGYWQALDKSIHFSFTKAKRKKAVDLSIILPTMNVADLLPDLLDSMYEGLARTGFSFEVFAIDDGSTDGTVAILREFADNHKWNFFLLSTSSGANQLGAGRARNRAIPLCEGRFIYFVDADDTYDFPALADAVQFAYSQRIDLLMLPYQVEYVRVDGSSIDGMLVRDQRIWNKVQNPWWGRYRTEEGRKEAALGLINYPWKQLTSAQLIRDADVYFGPTRVHNDVQFHWTSIAGARNIFFHDKVVCTHRKFHPDVRGQLTEVKSAVRISVFDAIGLTQRALARQGAFEAIQGGKSTFKQWGVFVQALLRWASERIPDDLMPEFEEHRSRLEKALKKEQPSSFRNWPYWGERLPSPPPLLADDGTQLFVDVNL